MPLYYDPEDVEGLAIDTKKLCGKLDELGQQLRDGTVVPADVKADFDVLYQPHALALADAMKEHLPDDDPRITIVFKDGNRRITSLNERPFISSPLQEYDAYTAGVQLQTIASFLRKLAGSLPEPANQ